MELLQESDDVGFKTLLCVCLVSLAANILRHAVKGKRMKFFVPLFLFALIAQPLFYTRPAAAQGSNRWVVDVENNGCTVYTTSDYSFLYPIELWNDHMTQGADGVKPFWPGDHVTAISTGTAKLLATWVDYLGRPAPNPPTKVLIRACPWAAWRINSYIGMTYDIASHTAVNGDGKPEVLGIFDLQAYCGNSQTPLYTDDLMTQKTKPITLDGSSGTATKEYVMSASIDFTSVNAEGSFGANCQLYASPLNFYGKITSSIDPTYHREIQNGAPVRAVNTSDSNNNTHADSALNDSNLEITYKGAAFGDWSSQATYHWHSFAKDYGFDGAFWYIDDLVNTYTPSTQSGGDTIDLHLKDSEFGYDMYAFHV